MVTWCPPSAHVARSCGLRLSVRIGRANDVRPRYILPAGQWCVYAMPSWVVLRCNHRRSRVVSQRPVLRRQLDRMHPVYVTGGAWIDRLMISLGSALILMPAL